MASRKVDFALAVRGAVTDFAESVERIGELAKIFADSGYNGAGGNPITDEDIEGHDITAVNLAGFAIFATNLELFMAGGDPAEIDYRAPINAFRGM